MSYMWDLLTICAISVYNTMFIVYPKHTREKNVFTDGVQGWEYGIVFTDGVQGWEYGIALYGIVY